MVQVTDCFQLFRYQIVISTGKQCSVPRKVCINLVADNILFFHICVTRFILGQCIVLTCNLICVPTLCTTVL